MIAANLLDDGILVIKWDDKEAARIPIADEIYEQTRSDTRSHVYWNATLAIKMGKAGLLLLRRADISPWTCEAILKMYPDLDTTHAANSDLEEPIVVVMGGEVAGDLLIDGWHRVYKACHLGLPTLPTYIVDPEAAKAVRLGETPKAAPNLSVILNLMSMRGYAW